MIPVAKTHHYSTTPSAQLLAEALSFDGRAPSLILLFGSAELEPELIQTAQILRTQFPQTPLAGSSAEGVLADLREFEDEERMVLIAFDLPAANLITFALDFLVTREGHAFTGWPSELNYWNDVKGVVALADPFSFPMDAWLDRMNEDRPAIPVLGGMCSGGHEPGGSCLLWNDQVLRQGAVIVLLKGDFEVTPVVSQGCRPLGEPYTITKVDANVVLELNGQPALRILHDLFMTLPTHEQESFRHGLQLGRLIPDASNTSAHPSYLIRNIVGCDSEGEGVIVGDRFQLGDIVQFHLRDEATAIADFAAQLRASRQSSDQPPKAGVLFTCNGRGTRLFSSPDQDVRAIRNIWPDLPIVGCQAAGEIGPVGQQSFVHGHTASLLLLGARRPKQT